MARAIEFAIPGVRDVFLAVGCRCTTRLLLYGEFEDDSLEKWVELCSRGGTVLDVGAYSGVYTIAAVRAGAKPIAVEPVPILCKRIRRNIKMNEVEATIIEKAANDREGKAPLYYNHHYVLTSGSTLVNPRNKYHAFREVETFRLDSLELDSLTAIKMDVEHAELQALAGAMGLIYKFRPTIIVEMLDNARRRAVLDLLPNYEFVCSLDRRNVLLEPKDGN